MNISDMAKYNIASPETLKRISGRFSDSFKSGITDALELKNMRGRFWFIPPGENISTPHKHGVQEEIYYQIKGPGKILFGKGGEEVLEVPEGSVVSVPPETWRQVYNDTEEEHIWLIIGSPAVENDGIH
ncbi:MAG: cupin domain-containing protein [Halobacteriales archaeon]